MADSNPTGGGSAVPLLIPAGNEPFLRRVIGAAWDGLREELDRFGDQLREPRSKLLLEDAAYAALLDGMDRGIVVPDDDLRAVLAQLRESVDHGNEYGRVVAEHEAIRDLLTQIGGQAR